MFEEHMATVPDQFINLPLLLSTTATRLSSPKSCPTKPKLSAMPTTQVGLASEATLHNQDASAVGRTMTRTSRNYEP
jgi:hypothetical protein